MNNNNSRSIFFVDAYNAGYLVRVGLKDFFFTPARKFAREGIELPSYLIPFTVSVSSTEIFDDRGPCSRVTHAVAAADERKGEERKREK